ncbi:MAG: ribosome assembly RNA-binding protein YhbY [Clostridia bacterium]
MALSGREKRYLKSLANTLPAIIQIGKSGISENLLKQIDDTLVAREILKLTILNNCEIDVNEISLKICLALNADLVQVIGHKITIYKKNTQKQIIIFP